MRIEGFSEIRIYGDMELRIDRITEFSKVKFSTSVVGVEN